MGHVVRLYYLDVAGNFICETMVVTLGLYENTN